MKFKNVTFLISLYICLPLTLIPATSKQTSKKSWFRSSWPDVYRYSQPKQNLANFFWQDQTLQSQTMQPTKCYPIITIPTLQQNSSAPWTLRRTNLETSGNGGIFDNPELLWKDARANDGTNCGYHALKNLAVVMSAISTLGDRFYQNVMNQASILRQQLISLDYFLDYFGTWAPTIFQKRKQDILRGLQSKQLIPLEQTIDMPLNKSFLNTNRSKLPESIRSFINMNEGYIKIENLIGSELELILRNEEFNAIKNNIIIIEYNPELIAIDVDPIGELNQIRIQEFLQSNNDTLGIIWNETGGFNHWVSFVAHKKDGNTFVYYINSINSRNPRYADAILNLLCPDGFKTKNDIETVSDIVDIVKSVSRS